MEFWRRTPCLKRLQKRNQIGLLLRAQADVEAAIVEVDTSANVAANPLWKYGARAARPRRIGPLNTDMCFHLPVINARPGSVVRRTSPVVLFRNVYSGMSGVRMPAVVRPRSSGKDVE